LIFPVSQYDRMHERTRISELKHQPVVSPIARDFDIT
jgi:hypothetical protein